MQGRVLVVIFAINRNPLQKSETLQKGITFVNKNDAIAA
jgi:hypothetical protein